MRLIGCDALVVVQRLSNRSVNLLVDGFRKLLRGKEHLIRVIHVCVFFSVFRAHSVGLFFLSPDTGRYPWAFQQ